MQAVAAEERLILIDFRPLKQHFLTIRLSWRTGITKNVHCTHKNASCHKARHVLFKIKLQTTVNNSSTIAHRPRNALR